MPHVTRTDHGARDEEIDVIVLDPDQGLLVLEVKGGKEVGYDQDRGWYSTSYGGETHSTMLGFKRMNAPAVILFDVMTGHVASRDPHVYVGCSRTQNLL